MAFVAHDILGPHTRLPDAGGDRAPQNQVGAEHSALAHLCARFKEAALPVPPDTQNMEMGAEMTMPRMQAWDVDPEP
jgi:hypothetical protein